LTKENVLASKNKIGNNNTILLYKKWAESEGKEGETHCARKRLEKEPGINLRFPITIQLMSYFVLQFNPFIPSIIGEALPSVFWGNDK